MASRHAGSNTCWLQHPSIKSSIELTGRHSAYPTKVCTAVSHLVGTLHKPDVHTRRVSNTTHCMRMQCNVAFWTLCICAKLCWCCREPALAAYEAEEVLQRGSLAFVSSLASSVANGVLGVAKAAAWGRQAGYRAGCTHILYMFELKLINTSLIVTLSR